MASVTVLQNRLLSRARFRHMQVLVALAELGSVRRAADATAMTQPGVSKLIADLERLLDVKLFHRHARGVRPTPVCTELLALANQTLRGVEAAAAAVAARQNHGEGSVRVTGSTAALNGILAGALPAFHQAHPAIQVQVKEAEFEDVLLGISRGEVDMGACRRSVLVPQGWRFEELVPDEMVVVAGAHHPLARKRRLLARDLEGESWLPGPAGAASRPSLEAIARDFDSPPRICEVVTRVPTVMWWMLRQTRVLGVVPYSVVRHYVESGELSVLKLEQAMPLEPLGVLVPQEGLQPALARLIDFLLAHKDTTRPHRRKQQGR